VRLQSTSANCGPASLSNALAAVGVVRTEAECEALCATTGTDGTSARGLLKAVRAVGREPIVIDERRALVAYLRLEAALRVGRAVVLCVDAMSHWVAAVGLLGARVLVADPADNELVTSVTPDALEARWSHNGRRYGVEV